MRREARIEDQVPANAQPVSRPAVGRFAVRVAALARCSSAAQGSPDLGTLPRSPGFAQWGACGPASLSQTRNRGAGPKHRLESVAADGDTRPDL